MAAKQAESRLDALNKQHTDAVATQSQRRAELALVLSVYTGISRESANVFVIAPTMRDAMSLCEEHAAAAEGKQEIAAALDSLYTASMRTVRLAQMLETEWVRAALLAGAEALGVLAAEAWDSGNRHGHHYTVEGGWNEEGYEDSDQREEVEKVLAGLRAL